MQDRQQDVRFGVGWVSSDTGPYGRPPLEPLTWREEEVLRLLGERRTNREIAQALGIEVTTVKWYNRQIYDKLGVNNRREAAAQATALGLPDTTPKPAIRQHNLPFQVTSFIGRQRELARITDQLAAPACRLLTLTGPPGTGKTRLALEAAGSALDSFRDGAIFVALAPVQDANLVAGAIAQAMGIKEAAGIPSPQMLQSDLRSRQMLLLLDNFEHVMEAAPLVADLLAGAPDLTVMVTSRESLRLSGEHEYAVPPLATPDLKRADPLDALAGYEAVALFVQRTQAIRPDFSLTDDNAPIVAEICVQLDGLPLALELAAARARLLSLRDLRDRLESRLETLRGGLRDLSPRHQTLRATIDWSYHLLDPEERALFNRLGVFVGGCTLEAAESVCGANLSIAILDGLEGLLNKSMVKRERGQDGRARFTLLETLREYALERLEESGEIDALRAAHAGYYVGLTERANPELRGPEQSEWLARLEAELENLRAALGWSVGGADAALGLRLAGALDRFWWVQGRHVEGLGWTERALQHAADAPIEVRARALNSVGFLGSYLSSIDSALGDPERGVARSEEALALFRELGDRRNEAWARAFLGMAALSAVDLDRGETLYREALDLFREVEDPDGIAWVFLALAEIARNRGDYDLAERLQEQSLALYRETGGIRFIAELLFNMGSTAFQRGEYERMPGLYAECLKVAWEQGHRDLRACALAGVAGAIGIQGQPEAACRLFGASEAALEALGIGWASFDQPVVEGMVAAVRAELDEAAFRAAWEEGRAMSVDEAVSYALGGGGGG